MVQLSFAATLALAAATGVLATPQPITPDPNGASHVGNAQGQQFITGGCLSTKDCSQAVVQSCCAFIAGGGATGICSGIDVGNVNGKAGCGFGDPPSGSGSGSGDSSAAAPPPAAGSSAPAAAPAPAAAAQDPPSAGSPACAVNSNLAGSQNVGKAAASQFITGQCLSKADCASGCCVAQASGAALCKAQLVTQEAGLSCDFTCQASPVQPVAPDAGSSNAAAPSQASSASSAGSASGSGSGSCAVNSNLAGSQNVGTGAAAQFITGQCFSPADCASGCCVSQASGTALCKARLVTEQAGLTCDFSCQA